MTTVEERSFQVDNRIIYDLVFKQSHSLEGALTELVQNSYDAGATYVNINFDELKFEAVDDGRGFRSKEEITQWFEIFGLPHEQEDDSRFGRFRMGRGQIMGHASTIWSSGHYVMDVDVKKRGLNYKLKNEMTNVCGCKITGWWYRDDKGMTVNRIHPEKTPADDKEIRLRNLTDDLINKVRFIFGIQVYINGVLANDVSNMKWDYEDDVFLFKKEQLWMVNLKKADYNNTISLYNLGAEVTRFKIAKLEGIVVSKKHLTLNLTRSQVQDNCPVLKHIKKTLRSIAPKYSVERSYSPHESKEILLEALQGHISLEEALHLPLFPDIRNNKYYSLHQLNSSCYFVAGKTDKEKHFADLIYTQSLCVVLSAVCDFSYTKTIGASKESLSFDNLFYSTWPSQLSEISANRLQYDDLKHSIDIEKNELEDESLPPKTLLKLKALRACNNSAIAKLLNLQVYQYDTQKWQRIRALHVGTSTSYSAWTDCENKIVIELSVLEKMDEGYSGVYRILTVLIHEYCHTKDTETHDYEFMENFHRAVADNPLFIQTCEDILRKYDDLQYKAKVKPTSKVLRALKSIRRSGLSKHEQAANEKRSNMDMEAEYFRQRPIAKKRHLNDILRYINCCKAI